MSVSMPFDAIGPQTPFPIVLVPGGLSGWASWKPHAEILSNNHRVIRVQLLNMAAAENNQVPAAGYSLRQETEALKNTMDKTGAARVNLVGWSHGGEVSLDLALNYPGRIKTLTLIEPAAYWVARAHDMYEEEENEFREFFRRIHEPVTEDDLIRFLRWNGLVPEGTDPRSLPQWPVWTKLKVALLSVHTVIEHDDDIARLQTLKGIPVLLVKGKDSTGANPGIVDLLATDLGSDARVLVLPDSHASHVIAKDKFIEELERFIKAH